MKLSTRPQLKKVTICVSHGRQLYLIVMQRHLCLQAKEIFGRVSSVIYSELSEVNWVEVVSNGSMNDKWKRFSDFFNGFISVTCQCMEKANTEKLKLSLDKQWSILRLEIEYFLEGIPPASFIVKIQQIQTNRQ